MFSSRKISLIILAITSIVFSRALFSFINDPEGPNLLVVVGMSTIVYFLSVLAYLFNSLILESNFKKVLSVIFIQILFLFALYFFIK